MPKVQLYKPHTKMSLAALSTHLFSIDLILDPDSNLDLDLETDKRLYHVGLAYIGFWLS